MSGVLRGLSIAVTGGAGFLGRAVVARLAARSGTVPFVPRSRDYDLRREVDARRFVAAARPDVVVHLAAASAASVRTATTRAATSTTTC